MISYLAVATAIAIIILSWMVFAPSYESEPEITQCESWLQELQIKHLEGSEYVMVDIERFEYYCQMEFEPII